VSIAAAGTVAGYEGYGFDGLSLADKLKVIAVVGIPLALLIFVIYLVILRRIRRR
jgi:hypothetical protein